MSASKQAYRQLCQQRDDIPIFAQAWWLEEVCQEGDWDVCLSYDKKGQITGALPYYLTTHKGFKVIRMPKLTPYMGVQLFYPSESMKAGTKFSFEKEVTQDLIRQLPKVHFFMQNMHPSITNWLPFFWSGYSQYSKYTFLLPDLSNLHQIEQQFRTNTKRSISKANNLVITETDDISTFLNIKKLSYKAKGSSFPISSKQFKQLDIALQKKQLRRIWIAKDDKGAIHAAGYFIHDSKTVYYLGGGTHPDHARSNGISGILWQAIRHYADIVQVFDFEGSVNDGIAHFFAGFGGELTPYHSISKGKNKVFDALKVLRS